MFNVGDKVEWLEHGKPVCGTVVRQYTDCVEVKPYYWTNATGATLIVPLSQLIQPATEGTVAA